MKFVLLLCLCIWAICTNQMTGFKDNYDGPNGSDSRENGRDGPPDGRDGPPDGHDGPPDKPEKHEKNDPFEWIKGSFDWGKNKSENIPLHIAVRTGTDLMYLHFINWIDKFHLN